MGQITALMSDVKLLEGAEIGFGFECVIYFYRVLAEVAALWIVVRYSSHFELKWLWLLVLLI